MSKIDELVKVFDDAAAQEHLRKLSNPNYKFDVRDMVRAGTRAVVTALRDELMKNRWRYDFRDNVFNEILGDAGEKVAGGTSAQSREAGYQTRPVEPNPATDPAPDVCSCQTGAGASGHCKLHIKFTEGK